jgi:pyridoxal phosphate enzyme (YggS family)
VNSGEPSDRGDAGALVRRRVDEVRDRIVAAGGDPEAITLVAVTKGFGATAVQAALAAGLTEVGENYAQELAAKAETLAAAGVSLPSWHFVGQLQRNKVRSIVPLVALWQTVDRPELGREIARRASGARVLVQVNLTDDPRRGGCRPSAASGLVRELGDLGLDVRGLMAVGPAGPSDQARPGFRLVRELADRLSLDECSIGMTDDLEVAVQEGSTMVRVGTALFGPRPAPRFC